MPPRYAESVFINCPFDTAYGALLDAIVFAVHDCGFVARSALEVRDTGEVRMNKILRLIRSSRFGIHDISRTELDPKFNLPRFNMPLELGLFLGAKAFGVGIHKRKVCLVLDSERFRYQIFCSDIAGQDPASHSGDPAEAIVAVRDFLSPHTRSLLPGGRRIVERYAEFRKQLPDLRAAAGLTEDTLTFPDYSALVSVWLSAHNEI